MMEKYFYIDLSGLSISEDIGHILYWLINKCINYIRISEFNSTSTVFCLFVSCFCLHMLVLCLNRPMSNPRSIALVMSMLTIAPPRRFNSNCITYLYSIQFLEEISRHLYKICIKFRVSEFNSTSTVFCLFVSCFCLHMYCMFVLQFYSARFESYLENTEGAIKNGA
jgi:hypothetical protein